LIDSTAVDRYARALLGLAEERKILPQVEKDLARVRQFVSQYPEISHLVLNSTISHAEKEDFIGKIIPSDVNPLVLEFIKVLMKKNRFRELGFIQERFHRLYEKHQGIEEVTCITAVPLNAAIQEKLKTVLKRRLKSEILLTTETDPRILGGMILRFSGQEIDGSFRGRLDELRQMLTA